jgi:hypothetical protein
MQTITDFTEQLDKALKNKQFIKLTLSKPLIKSASLRNIYGKVVNIKSGDRLSLTFRYTNRDEVKNIGFDQL